MGRPRKFKKGQAPWEVLGIPERTYYDYLKNPEYPKDASMEDQKMWIMSRSGQGTGQRTKTALKQSLALLGNQASESDAEESKGDLKRSSDDLTPEEEARLLKLRKQAAFASLNLVITKDKREKVNLKRDQVGKDWDIERHKTQRLKRKILDEEHIPVEVAYEMMTTIIAPFLAELDAIPNKHAAELNPDAIPATREHLKKIVADIRYKIYKVLDNVMKNKKTRVSDTEDEEEEDNDESDNKSRRT